MIAVTLSNTVADPGVDLQALVLRWYQKNHE